jgi:hypothetical protein
MAMEIPDTKSPPPMGDASAALSDLLRTGTTFWQGQLDRWASALDQMRKGSYGGSRLLQDVAGTLDSWTLLLAGSFQRGAGTERPLPTLLFIVDGDAEFVGPVDAATSVYLPPGVTTVVTDLYPIGGKGTKGGQQTAGPYTIDASSHVRAQFSPARDRVEVSLVDLGRGQAQRNKRGLSPGLYVGAVSATEVATRHPLALVYALVEESVTP